MDLRDAITHRRVVQFVYDGHPRVVHPAAYGRHRTTGNVQLRGYQVAGSSATRVPPLWDLFLVDKIEQLVVLDDTFLDDPPGFKPGDKHLYVECEL